MKKYACRWCWYTAQNRVAGFTIVELLVTIGIVIVLFGFIGFGLLRAQQNTSLSAVLSTMVADIKSQQIKAMTGNTEGRTTNDSYGIYVQSNRYTLFHSMTYTPNDPSNVAVSITSPNTLSSTLPNGLLIFSKVSGEMAGWASGQNTITITNTTSGSRKTITINQYGVITNIQ